MPFEQTLDRAAVRSLRGPKKKVDPWTLIGTHCEQERTPEGDLENAATFFLAGAECPFTCVFCDLWQWTLDAPTPPGAIPAQIEQGLELLADRHVDVAKLYNASNFFSQPAVPSADLEVIADLLRDVPKVVVESHPRLIDRRAIEFDSQLGGSLEVAMGLETVDDRLLAMQGKDMTVADFDRAATFLRQAGIRVRAFAIVGLPFAGSNERVLEGVQHTVRHAADLGVDHIALIPARGGNGAMDRFQHQGNWAPPALLLLEQALDRTVERSDIVVSTDLWDLERLADCWHCFAARRDRLQRINLSGTIEPRIPCRKCESGDE